MVRVHLRERLRDDLSTGWSVKEFGKVLLLVLFFKKWEISKTFSDLISVFGVRGYTMDGKDGNRFGS